MHRTRLALVLILAGCSHPEPEVPEPPTVGLFMFDAQAVKTLESLGIDREPVGVIHVPMALDRLYVTLGSLNQEVEDLGITLVQTGDGWRLESPTMEVISAWLSTSDGE